MFDRNRLLELYSRLYDSYGPQHWWPADTPFEVMVGAILTQNTSWKNVEKALANLRESGCLGLAILGKLDIDTLAAHVRPSGFFNIKARRLLNLCHWLEERGGIEKLQHVETAFLRQSLLEVNGVGPETADDILLYALERPVFVIDAYTRRLFRRLELINGDEEYELLRNGMEKTLGPDPALFNEFHALIVRHAKEKCSSTGAGSTCKHCYVEYRDNNECLPSTAQCR